MQMQKDTISYFYKKATFLLRDKGKKTDIKDGFYIQLVCYSIGLIKGITPHFRSFLIHLLRIP